MARLYDAANVREATACGCDSRRSLPGWLLDKIADEKFLAGWDTRRSNQCPTCFEFRSVNGSCACS